MNKVISILMVLGLVASVAVAGMDVNEKGSFVATGASASTTIDKGNGTIVANQLSVNVQTNKSVSIYRPSIEAKEKIAEVAGTAVSLYTSVSNKVEGYTITTSDFFLFHNDTSGWQLTQVSAIGATATNSAGKITGTLYTTTDNVTVDIGDPAYICKGGDTLVYTGFTADTLKTIPDAFTSKGKNPVHILVTAGSGTETAITGTYSVEK